MPLDHTQGVRLLTQARPPAPPSPYPATPPHLRRHAPAHTRRVRRVRQAAEMGSAEAHYHLGVLFSRGAARVPQDNGARIFIRCIMPSH